MSQAPLPQFIHSIQAILRYWRSFTVDLDDRRLEDVDSERQNLYRAVEFGLKRPEAWPDVAWVALQTFRLVDQRGYWREWIPILSEATGLCQEEELKLKFDLLSQLGQMYRSDGQICKAITIHGEALTIAELLAEPVVLADAALHLSVDHWRNREYDESERFGLLALRDLRDIEEAKLKMANALAILGLISYRRGDLAEAEQKLTESVAVYRQTDDVLQLARSLNNLAILLQAQKKYDLALERFHETAVLLEPTAHSTTKVAIWVSLGTLHFELGQLEEAKAAFFKANAPEFRNSVDIFNRALVDNNLGSVLTQQGQFSEAERFLKSAISLWQQTDEKLELAVTKGNLAEVYDKQGRPETAVQLYQEAVVLLSAFPNDARATQIREEYLDHIKTLSN